MEAELQGVYIHQQPSSPPPLYAKIAPSFPVVEQPRDFVLWSLFNVLACQMFACLGCVGFPALIFSVKSRDRKVVRDLESARSYGATAKVLNILTSLLLVAAVVAFIVLLVM